MISGSKISIHRFIAIYIYSCVRRWFANEGDTCEKDPVDTRRLHSVNVGRVKEQQRTSHVSRKTFTRRFALRASSVKGCYITNTWNKNINNLGLKKEKLQRKIINKEKNKQ